MEKIVKIKITQLKYGNAIFKEIHVNTETMRIYKDMYDCAKQIWLTNYLNQNCIFFLESSSISEMERKAQVKIDGISVTPLREMDFGDAFDE